MEFLVKATCITNSVAGRGSPPKSRLSRIAVGALCTCTFALCHSFLWLDQWSVAAVDLVVEAARVAQVVAVRVASPQRRRDGRTVHALSFRMLARFSPFGWLRNGLRVHLHLRELAHRGIVLEVDRVADILRRQALVVDALHGVRSRRHRVQLDLRHGGATGLGGGRSGGLGCTCMVDVEVEIGLEAGNWRHLGGLAKIAVVAERQRKMRRLESNRLRRVAILRIPDFGHIFSLNRRGRFARRGWQVACAGRVRG